MHALLAQQDMYAMVGSKLHAQEENIVPYHRQQKQFVELENTAQQHYPLYKGLALQELMLQQIH
jgi:hypothetical protein